MKQNTIQLIKRIAPHLTQEEILQLSNRQVRRLLEKKKDSIISTFTDIDGASKSSTLFFIPDVDKNAYKKKRLSFEDIGFLPDNISIQSGIVE